MKYPNPLQQGSTIAITAFSSGIAEKHEARFQVVKEHLLSQGFKVVVGDCLYGQKKHVSAPIEQRAKELMSFLTDESIDAIFPPWGGELAIEILPYLDFSKLKQVRPKWILGFSDVSTLAATFASKLRWATAHCSNLMDLTPEAIDPLTANTLKNLGTSIGAEFSQVASPMYASSWPDIVNNPKSGITPDTKSCWKWLVKPKSGTVIKGRLIGGCWDTLSHLFETEYLDLKALSESYPEGVVLYLENAEMSPTELTRTILNMKFRGVFSHINGLLLGRSAASNPHSEQALTYYEAIENSLTNIGVPVMIDLDIGHVPPNLTLINGAVTKVGLDDVGVISQHLI
ncbi:TPA: S66 peptidase family protein [Vibrio diabolicus]